MLSQLHVIHRCIVEKNLCEIEYLSSLTRALRLLCILTLPYLTVSAQTVGQSDARTSDKHVPATGIRIEPPFLELDAADLEKGSAMRRILLKNEGPSARVIHELVSTSHRARPILLGEKELAPGEEAKIRVSLVDTKRLGSDQYIYVRFTDGAELKLPIREMSANSASDLKISDIEPPSMAETNRPNSIASDTSVVEGLFELLPTEIDLGKLRRSTKIQEALFSVKNISALPLEIVSVTSGCGCTVASLTTRSLPPGETTILKALVDPSQRIGHFSVPISVKSKVAGSSKGEGQTMSVQVSGLVEQDYIYSPERLIFSDRPGNGNNDPIIFQVKSTQREPLTLIKYTENLEHFVVSSILNGLDGVLTLEMKPIWETMTPGTYTEPFRLTFKIGDSTTDLDLTLDATKLGNWEVIPTRLMFGYVNRAKGGAQSAQFLRLDKRANPLTLEHGPDIVNGELSIEMDQLTGTTTVSLVLGPNSHSAPGAVKDRVLLTDGEHTYTLPIYIVYN